ncbi:MAG: hypothetical protein M1831_003750 [Alyxoria varia]|nr:MAG: hypothetical protein M1831_003750 [Alyxoria varia]
MSGRRASNRIRGPQSALTDFLAANNISARQIRDTHQRRAAEEAQQEVPQNEPAAEGQGDQEESGAAEESEPAVAAPQTRKRKRAAEPPKGKGKGKEKPTKKPRKNEDSDDDSDADYEDLGKDMYKKALKKPGQLENCDVCGKRFTVTPYSQQGPDGGLCCTPCGKQLKNEKKADDKAKRKPVAGGRKRRQLESSRLDGHVRVGARSLQDMCIEMVAKHHLDVEEFGDLPENLLGRLSQIFSKKRVLDPRTVKLFLRSDLDTVAIHDAALLEENDFKLIFAMVPNISKLVLRNAGQFKDSVVDYMLEKATNISYLQLYGSNLITGEAWQRLFKQHGPQLRALKLQWCDTSFTDETVATIVANCPDLESLKLKYCRKLTTACLPLLKNLKRLTSLSLRFADDYDPEGLAEVIATMGHNLKTLSIENCFGLDERIIEAIRLNCSNLSKLRLTEIDNITDETLATLFQAPAKNQVDDGAGTVVPALTFVDLSCARDVDNNNPLGPEDEPIGLSTSSFTALMKHSHSKLRVLNIPSCRHVSHAAFCDAFSSSASSTSKTMRYPHLHTMDLSFCSSVDTSVMKGVLATCPSIKKIVAFGCFKIEDVGVPAGVAVIGVPRAQEAIEKVGDEGVDLERALQLMGGLISASA